MLRLDEKYQKEVIPAMMERFGYKNKMAVPKIEKVILNIGFGRLMTAKSKLEQEKIIHSLMEDLSLISGQKPILCLAKKSISTFKIRQGMPIGAKVTLRKKRMFDFLERLIHIALPRFRDFKGIDLKSFDQKGNLTIGLPEQLVFPEILPEKAKIIFGLEITIRTTAKTREEGIELLKLFGFPIKI